MNKGIIFDFNRTLYDPDSDSLVNGVVPLLSYLSADFGLCLISKRSGDRESWIRELGISGFFKDIQFVDNKTIGTFQHCMDVLSLPAHNIYVVGDRIKEEIYIGNLCEMNTIWYKSGKFAEESFSTLDEIPDHTISDLDDLYFILSED